MWLWSVLTTAMLTLKALASGAVESAFHLSFGSLAIWAFLHVKRYNTVRADLDSPPFATRQFTSFFTLSDFCKFRSKYF